MWLVKKALIFLLHLLPFISGQEFESTVIILKYEKGSLFHTGLCTGSQLDKGGVVTHKDCFDDFSKLRGAVGISRVSHNSHEVRFFKTCVLFEGWSVLTTSRPFTWQANSAARSKRSQPSSEKTSCIFDIIHEPFINMESKKGNLMCDKELTAIFSQSGTEWFLRQMRSNFTLCLKRNDDKKCKDERLSESKFAEFNKDFKKQIKFDLRKHPDRFRNKLVQMNNYDISFLEYQMETYQSMRVVEREQEKPIDHAIHVRFNSESMKALGTDSRDHNAFRVKRLIAPTPALSHNLQPKMNFRTDPNGNLTNYTTSDVANISGVILDSAKKNPPQGLSNDSIKVIRSTEDLKESSVNTATNTKSLLVNSTFNFTDIPIRSSEYHDQIDTSGEGKYEPSATKAKPNPPSDHLNNTETGNYADYSKVRERDLPNLRRARKEESTTTIMKSGENYAQGKLSARKEDSTSNVTEIPSQSSASALADGITQEEEETPDGGEIRERGSPVSRYVRKEGSATNAIMELANNHAMLGNVSAVKEASSGLSSISAALKTEIVVQIENSSDGSKVRARDIPISRSEKQESSTTKITELSQSYTKDKLSEDKGDSESVIADKPPHSPETVPQIEDSSDETDNDYGNVKERSILSSGLVTNESSPSEGTRDADKTILQDYIVQRDGFGNTRNTDYKSAHKDSQIEEEEDYDKFMYREGEVNEGEEEYPSTEEEGFSMRKSRASSQKLHLTITLFIFIIRFFSAFTSEVIYYIDIDVIY